MTYLLLKWLHVVSAIVAVGANATYGIWIARGRRQPQTLSFALRGVKLIDDRLANPAYGFLLITGLAMAFTSKLPLSTPWLSLGMTLYVVLVLVGLLGYTPTLKQQITVLEREGADSVAYRRLSRRGARLGAVLGVLALGIVFLMVVKPALWA